MSEETESTPTTYWELVHLKALKTDQYVLIHRERIMADITHQDGEWKWRQCPRAGQQVTYDQGKIARMIADKCEELNTIKPNRNP